MFQQQNNRKKTYNSNFRPNTGQNSGNGQFSGGNNQNFKPKNFATGQTINNSGNTSGTSKPQCQICSKFGHTALQCWYRFNSDYQPKDSKHSTSNNPQAMTATSATIGDTSWFLDTGATHYLTSDLNNLTIHNPFTRSDKVIVGDGKGLSIANIGKFSLASSNGSLVFNDVLHVPSITTNLVSVQRFCSDNGTFIEFHPSHFVVKDQKTRLALLQGKIEKGLYKLPAAPRVVGHPLAFYSTSSTSDAGSLRLWHNRLGHPSVDVVSKILSLCKIPLKHDNNKVCESCQLAKSHRLPFEISTSKAIKPFGLIHVDLWGAAPIVSVNGARYFLLLIDDFSRFSWLYLLETKDEALLMFQHFQAMVERQFDTKIQCVQSDGGVSFRLLIIIWLQMVFFIKSLVLILLSKMEELKGRIIMLWKLVFLC